jgi:hypothetical protein
MIETELKEPRAFREAREEGKVEAKKEAQAETIEAILLARFGAITSGASEAIDEELAKVVPKLMQLESTEYAELLINLSRSPLAQAKLSELLALP